MLAVPRPGPAVCPVRGRVRWPLPALRLVPVGPYRVGACVVSPSPFHPETLAQGRAHKCQDPGRLSPCPIVAPGHVCPERGTCRRRKGGRAGPPVPCTCTPDPADLAELWAGRARMAAARLAAGVALDALDREALARLDTSAGETAA
jgi:hypothetical protein